jgi:hypothetical protein
LSVGCKSSESHVRYQSEINFRIKHNVRE